MASKPEFWLWTGLALHVAWEGRPGMLSGTVQAAAVKLTHYPLAVKIASLRSQ
jgi:hypothetical protein